MSNLANFFLRNISEVYFIYGLSFFCMGLAVLLEVGHSSELDFARALRPLAGFGLVHGCHEWFEMFLLNHPEVAKNPTSIWIPPLRLTMLAISFLFLVTFGASLIAGPGRGRIKWIMMLAVIVSWGIGLLWVEQTQSGSEAKLVAADVYTRYSLAIPGAVLTVWGLILQRQKFKEIGLHSFGNDVALAALAFGLYGGIGQLFASPSAIFPSTYLNASVFIQWFGFPIQVFRAAMAAFVAFFIIRSLRAFEVENNQRVETLRETQLAERRRLEDIRQELLHRTVKAQEAERQRIARELHDETGQTLTALGMGLRGLSDTITTNPTRAIQQAKHLETLAVSGLEELQGLVGGLHPPQLDDLGLIPALRWYASEITRRYGLPITVSGLNTSPNLPPDVRAVFYRIAQEAITNVVRHSTATQASIQVENGPTFIRLRVEDNGQGFNVEETLRKNDQPHWGLLGMIERANLIQAACEIHSQPEEGTWVEVLLDREKEPHD